MNKIYRIILKYIFGLFVYFWINTKTSSGRLPLQQTKFPDMDRRTPFPSPEFWGWRLNVCPKRWLTVNTGRRCQSKDIQLNCVRVKNLKVSRIFRHNPTVRDRCLRQKRSEALFYDRQCCKKKITSTSTLKHISNSVQSKHDNVLNWNDNWH